MTKEKLKKILADHQLWLADKGGTRADLSGANLTRANLQGANLSSADLYGAKLSSANLSKANLHHANLYCANLTGANLTIANLSGAILSKANLSETDLSDTVLDPKTKIPSITDEEILAAGLELRGDRVYGWRTAKSTHEGDQFYVPGEVYEAPWFSVCTRTKCHPGIYLASKEWLKEMYPKRDLVRCYCLREELVHAVNKWRCKRLWVIEE